MGPYFAVPLPCRYLAIAHRAEGQEIAAVELHDPGNDRGEFVPGLAVERVDRRPIDNHLADVCVNVSADGHRARIRLRPPKRCWQAELAISSVRITQTMDAQCRSASQSRSVGP